jgi:hypothetical protein
MTNKLFKGRRKGSRKRLQVVVAAIQISERWRK